MLLVRAHRWLVEPRRALGDEAADLYAVTNYAILTGLLAFLAFVPLFLALGARSLALLNIGVALLLVVALWMVRGARVFAGMVFAAALVIGHAWVATLTLGWGSAFHLHIVLGLELGLLFAHVSLRVRLTLAAVVAAAYLGLMVTVRYVPPAVPLAPGWEGGLAMLNSSVF